MTHWGIDPDGSANIHNGPAREGCGIPGCDSGLPVFGRLPAPFSDLMAAQSSDDLRALRQARNTGPWPTGTMDTREAK
jgi:hypothetical protein